MRFHRELLLRSAFSRFSVSFSQSWRAGDRSGFHRLLESGIGMLVPFAVIVVMFLGSIVERIWWRADRRSNELYMVPLASGLIAGEAIVAVVVPLLVVLGIVH